MRNAELFYTHPASMMDQGGHWEREEAYFQGLGNAFDSATGTFDVSTTPSGEASAPPGGGGFFDTIGRSLSTLLPVAAQAYSVKKLTDLNIERSRSGLQPLSPQQYAAMVPAAQVTVGPNEQAKKLLMYGGAAVVGLVALRALKVI